MTEEKEKRVNEAVVSLETKANAAAINVTADTKNVTADTKADKNTDLDGLFCMLGEDSRIIIKGGQVMIENMSDDLLDLALSLNPNDAGLKQRQTELKAQKDEEKA